MEKTNFEDEKVYDDQGMGKKKDTQVIKDMSDIFVNPDERQIAIMQGRYLSNLIRKGQMTSGFGVLTDSRLYYRGESYHQEKWILYKTNEESIVDLQDITASGFIFRRNLILAAIAGFVTLIELLLIVSVVFSPPENVIEFWLSMLVGGGIIIALWALFIFFRQTIYQISHAGGMIAIKVYPNKLKQLRDFDKKLHQAKDEKVRELSGSGNALQDK